MNSNFPPVEWTLFAGFENNEALMGYLKIGEYIYFLSPLLSCELEKIGEGQERIKATSISPEKTDFILVDDNSNSSVSASSPKLIITGAGNSTNKSSLSHNR